MFRAFSKFVFFKLMGWTIEGRFPGLPKYVVIVAPHTSNWDFIIGVLGRSITGIKEAKYLGKSQLFKPPLGWLFRALGGYPVDRTKSNNLVDAVVDIFDKHERFCIALAPEGTRKKVARFKTGFYHIAKKADIPIVMVGFDYARKSILINEPFYTSEDSEQDIEQITGWYRNIKGKIPENGVG